MVRKAFSEPMLNLTCLVLLTLVTIPTNRCRAGTPDSKARAAPNIVLIMIDDLGWKDVGCYGNSLIETPNIDDLAKSGIRFTNFYAAGAVCSPTRCAIQTGQNQARIGITAHIPGHWRPFERVITPQVTMGLPQDIVTIADSLKASGYQTGYIGKWHLNDGPGFGPQSKGYDFSAVINGPHYSGRYRVVGRKDLKPKPGQYRTDFEADLAINFIQTSVKSKARKPFFLMISPFAVHIPLGAKKAKVEKYRKKFEDAEVDLPHPVYAAMVEHCDDMVGRIMNAINDAGIDQQTMVMFTSDNGGLYRRYDYRATADDNVTTMAPLRGEKGTLYEAGIRVPLIVRHPGAIPAGIETDQPAISYDFFPTCVDLAKGELPENQVIDGVSLVPIMNGKAKLLAERDLFWHYPHYHHSRPASCIRSDEWKLIEFIDGSGDFELYNLAKDIGEQNNLVSDQPEVANQLKRRLNKWRRDVLARMPLKNPNYDPQRANQWWSRRATKPVNSDARKRFPPTDESP